MLRGDCKKSKIFLAVALSSLIPAIIGLSCLKPPALPQWDVTITVPVFNGAIPICEFFSDTSKFLLQPDSSLLFRWRHQFGPFYFDSAFTLLNLHQNQSLDIADLVFSSVYGGKSGEGVSQLFGVYIPDSGLIMQVPAIETSFTLTWEESDFQFVELLEGVVSLKIVNRTPWNWERVFVQANGIAGSFSNIGPGEVQTQRLRTGGVYWSSPAIFEVSLAGAGTGGESVRVYPGDSIIFEVEFDSLRIGSGRMNLRNAYGEKRVVINMESAKPLRIDDAVFTDGECEFLLCNRLNVPVFASYEVSKIGLRSSVMVESERAAAVQFGLAGLHINNRGRINGLFDFLVRITLDSTSGFVDFAKGSVFDINYAVNNAQVQSLTGAFQRPVYIAAYIDTLALRAPFSLRGCRFSDAEIVLESENSVGFPLELLVFLKSYRQGMLVANAQHLIQLLPGGINEPGRFNTSIPIEELLNVGPDFITFEYYIRIYGSGKFERGQCLAGGGTINVPLRLALRPDTVFVPEREIVIPEDDQKKISQSLSGGELEISLKNETPLGVTGRLFLKGDSVFPCGGPALIDSLVIPFAVPCGEVGQGGRCVLGRDTVLKVELDSTEATIFRSQRLKVRLAFELPETDTIVIYSGDRISLTAVSRLRVRIKD